LNRHAHITAHTQVRSLEAAIGFVLYTLLLFVAASLLGLPASGSSDGNDSGGMGGSVGFFTTYVLALSFIL
jgi:hypothetical protein